MMHHSAAWTCYCQTGDHNAVWSPEVKSGVSLPATYPLHVMRAGVVGTWCMSVASEHTFSSASNVYPGYEGRRLK